MVFNQTVYDKLQELRYILLLIAYILVLWAPVIFQSLSLSDEFSDVSLIILIFAIFNFIRKTKTASKILTFITFSLIFGKSATVGTENDNASILSWLTLLIYFIFFLRILLLDVWNSKKVNMNTILGAIAGYIQIGVIAFILFKVCDILFDGQAFSQPVQVSDLIYFSFVTLTTVGFGDISPVADEVKAFTVIFAMVGQFYMAILMALLVGKYQQEHGK
ncbi:hypothetical protein KMW28_08570 [Flammeovirga yaeyamensis]|uniref:Potassium channel domain-containing protein n=1 Tax=Flammeovirga yaeyamensis TaxID=367791 RepID=A0AAX1N8Y9_9BACT|nr:two pore domain potassium channel family protein [Flammeovirga yaeyamensis]MBB3698985.1 hypothetical protein [Flammeovirga yaeyamensis]NMF36419.1 two pore domain potassium channel family protein [Flammeovirga yaeyamensis]QWG03621.1 hypothetical protein KMW28_08570 [Flammeovirga yaeyamensis]